MWTSLLRSALIACALAACADTFGLRESLRDSDGDGIADRDDNCPLDPNPGQEDRDGIAPGDACDVCPTEMRLGVDRDHDGRDDGCDGCVGSGVINVNADNDQYDDGCDPCVNGVSPFPDDLDNDGIPDACDDCVGHIGVDLDRDGVDDACDTCPAGPNVDEDADGIFDDCDNCPTTPNADLANSSPDVDAIGDACDPSYSSNEARSLYDPFRTFPVWTQFNPGTWKPLDGAALYGENPSLTAGPQSLPSELTSHVMISAPEYRVITHIRDVAAGTGGIVLPDIDRKTAIRCTLAPDALGIIYEGGNSDPANAVLLDNPDLAMYDLVVAVYSEGAAQSSVQCALVDRLHPTQIVPGFSTAPIVVDAQVRTPALFVTSGQVTFDWIEAIETTDFMLPGPL